MGQRHETDSFLPLIWLSGISSLLKPMKANVKNRKICCGRVRAGLEIMGREKRKIMMYFMI